jgi:16S rRNA C1402 N4-methylase RsmH
MQLNKKLKALESKLNNYTNIDSDLPSFNKTQSHPDLDVKSIDFVTENTSTSSKKSDSKKVSLVDLGIGSFTYDSKNSNFNYDLGSFEPVDTQQIYLDVYSLE